MNLNSLILVVEDNMLLRQATAQVLRQAGHDVLEVSTAADCLRLVQDKRPDLVLIDVVLPDENGTEVCRRIKSDPATTDIFVILISGFQIASEQHVAGLQAGADAYITRPIHNRELVARVQAMIRLQKTQAELRSIQQELERRVLERTAELTAANERLRAEIAERQQLEARLLQSQKLQAVGQLAAGVAHDFNNILTVIQCNASALQLDAQLSRESGESIRQISVASERAAGLTRQLLAFTRQQVFQLRELDLNALIEHMSKMLARTLGDHVALHLEPASQLPGVNADSGMIEQAILNLTINARDAMPNGGKLTVRTAAVEVDPATAHRNPESRPGSFVSLSVVDTGCGMDEDTLRRIFEPFFTTKDVGKGNGLGLASVHGIAGQHDGWVEVISEVGRGSTFTLFLPSLGRPARISSSSASSTLEAGGTETILVVEDEPVVRDLAKKVLTRYGYRILTAASGLEAIQLWRAHLQEIDLLLTDVLMPLGINGQKLAELLKRDNPDLKVVFTSGYGADILDEKGHLPGDVHFLKKPFGPGSLAKTVRDCLDGVAPDSSAKDLSSPSDNP